MFRILKRPNFWIVFLGDAFRCHKRISQGREVGGGNIGLFNGRLVKYREKSGQFYDFKIPIIPQFEQVLVPGDQKVRASL